MNTVGLPVGVEEVTSMENPQAVHCFLGRSKLKGPCLAACFQRSFVWGLLKAACQGPSKPSRYLKIGPRGQAVWGD